MSAVAFLAGMGAGYLSAKDKALERERQAARDKRDQTVFDQQQQDRTTAMADKQALRDAGSPVNVQETTQPFQSPADSGDMDMPVAAANTVPLAKNYKVGAKDFAGDGVAAQAEAAQQSSPDGVRSRTMAALAAQGNVVGADQMKTSGLQAEAAQMGINKGKREEANAIFDQGIHQALSSAGPDGLAKFMSDSHADGAKGATKYAAIANPNGKTWQIAQVEKDGKLTPIGKSFSNDENGYAEAGFMLSRAVPDKDKLAHTMQVQEAERKAKHDEGSLKVAQQNADTALMSAKSMEQWRKDQAAIARANSDTRRGAGKPGESSASDYDPLAGFDSKKAQAVAFEQASKEAQDSAGMGKPMTPKEQGQRAQQIFQATADAIATENKNRYVASVASKELRAVAADPAQYAATYQKAMAAGMTAPALASMGFKPPAPAQNTPRAAAANGVQPAAPAPAPVAAPAPQAAPKPMNTVDQIQQNSIAALAPLAQQYKQAQQQFVAAATSGDQQAVAKYMQAKEALRMELTKQAQAKFGNGADAVLQKLTAN